MFFLSREKIKNKKNNIGLFIKKNGSSIYWIIFLLGFIFDFITLTTVDYLLGNFLLSIYLFIVLFSIILSNYGDYTDIKNKFLFRIYQFSPLITQFSFGALFSGFIVYYTTSASFITSWPFILLLVILFLINDRIKQRYEKFEFQISIFFLSLYSFVIFFFPALAKRVGDEFFIASGIISLILIFWILKIIFKILPFLKKKKKKIFKNILIVFLFFNIAYFFHLIPPVPLSVKDIEIVHLTGKNSDNKYFITREKREWYQFYDYLNNVYHKRSWDDVYVYVSIFAPEGLKTKIYHRWEFFNTEKNQWETLSRFSYNLTGGRRSGHRGYSFITDGDINGGIKEGEWRVSVENNADVLMSRKKFQIKKINGQLPLETEVLK